MARLIPLGDKSQHYRDTELGKTITRRAADVIRRAARVATGAPLAVKRSTEDSYYKVVERLAQGESLARASRAEGISSETVKKLNAERGLFQAEYHQRRQANGATRPTTVKGYRTESKASTPILQADGTLIMGPSVDARYASLLGSYWNAVDAARQGKTGALRAFTGITIYTTDGQAHMLLTDSNAINALFYAMSDDDMRNFWENFYRGGGVYIHAA